ncbi:glycosyltransferase family 2 protein [Nocardioides yefusunii]|uniref:Glycosyltransferase family 2 protein n=1 Tax=Nocardioides yefusunii TaxID=2500546 RepID=A0ABW1QTV0_9ACTN|nr:glycosyltransferase family 2 protein [Nocardioides yefusunii]
MTETVHRPPDAPEPAPVSEHDVVPGLVSVVIPTRDRVELVRRAIASVFSQDHPGDIEVVVVFDQSPPDVSLLRAAPGRSVRIVTNTRTPGLAGARNSGIVASRGEWVAFCDDDDHWRASKLSSQFDAARTEEARTGAFPPLVTTSMAVDFDGTVTDRTAGTDRVGVSHLTRSRMAMLHSSSLLFTRAALLGSEDCAAVVGLVNEEIPGSQNEDWDILLRAAKARDIVHVDEPLVVVQWGAASFFTRSWDTKISSLHWMLEAHPEIVADRKGVSRVYGQVAFGEASRPHRRAAVRWAFAALARNPLQWRALVALAVAAGVVSPAFVLDTLHRFGRGV